ncbi:MAG: pantoate--beta-alanine ligase [Pseudomonadota bacterium]
MKVCRSVSEFRDIRAVFGAQTSLGLVPTMGALHAGHMALVAAAKRDNDRVAATIFVNPTQFGEAADLENYPRTEAEDLAKLERAGVDAVLIPKASDLYPDGAETIVETTRLANMLHGLVRPGHYRGVATVVTKLFNIANPNCAYFGEKDYQQLAVIRRMVRDLHMPVDIIAVPTQRDPDGLAMSSRNLRLSPEDRAAAPVLNAALDAAMTARTVEEIAATIRNIVGGEPRATLKGLDIVDAATFAPVTGPLTAKVGVMISAAFGPADDPVLLIDQREITP